MYLMELELLLKNSLDSPSECWGVFFSELRVTEISEISNDSTVVQFE